MKAVALLACLVATSAGAAEWKFRALLDDQPIGTHRFSVATRGDERTLLSEASFAVRFLGFTAYRYSHIATEQWRGDCLTALTATTDDDGKPSQVRIDGEPLKGCAMSFAYWNPLIRTQTRLLNAQTGRFETVQISRVGSGTLDVRGVPTAATRWRITGPANPIDIWYSPQGDWIGLDSTVAGGRKLSYRLE
ncbi:MAG: DUF6134 family protein [Burkholderiales bacterium]